VDVVEGSANGYRTLGESPHSVAARGMTLEIQDTLVDLDWAIQEIELLVIVS